ncbi:copper homeostasis periplasmic binding protein CopC [Actinoplanes sp. RD1]|uniref:copper homeostasis periplasmic binding protein CopC n=1 Tax=Actinoplanes sp. RD1 TaxID=3064538 RepID=UPI0027407823|nr:copper homeostasis periplasmic binding protein CopC [Actinoplanes sp. RD1]
MRNRRRLSLLPLLLAACAAFVLPGSPAWAHAQLTSSTPEEDATVKKAPAEITLKFSERLNPDFTTIVLSDAAKRKVGADGPEVDGREGTLTPAEPLANGTYTVAYRVVSVDGHTVQGSYSFTVADPSATAAPAPSATSAAPEASATSAAPAPVASAAASAAPATVPLAEESAEDDGVPAGVLVGIGVVALLLVAGAGYFWLSRRRGPAA